MAMPEAQGRVRGQAIEIAVPARVGDPSAFAGHERDRQWVVVVSGEAPLQLRGREHVDHGLADHR
jgi:hypothetical protein